jgi:hypothetical protein
MTETAQTAQTAQATSRREGSPCPNCGVFRVYRSRRKGITERLLAVVGANLRRCHACNVRFAMLFNSAVYIDDARRALRRLALLFGILVGAALIVLVMLWFMKKQAAIGPSDGLLVPARSAYAEDGGRARPPGRGPLARLAVPPSPPTLL